MENTLRNLAGMFVVVAVAAVFAVPLAFAHAEDGGRGGAGLRAFMGARFDALVDGKIKIPGLHRGAVGGEVQSVSTSEGTLVIESPRDEITIAVTGDTTIKIGDDETNTLADIEAGAHVRAKGAFDADAEIFSATMIVVRTAEDKEEHDEMRREKALQIIARLETFIANLKARLGL